MYCLTNLKIVYYKFCSADINSLEQNATTIFRASVSVLLHTRSRYGQPCDVSTEGIRRIGNQNDDDSPYYSTVIGYSWNT